MFKRFQHDRDVLELAYKKAAASRERTARQVANWVPLDEIHEALEQERESLGAEIFSDTAAPRLCKGGSPLEMYTWIKTVADNPSRLDLATCQIVNPGEATDPNTNYLELGDILRFVVHAWKNASRSETGERFIIPGPDTQELLKHYMRMYSKKAGDWLWTSARDGSPLTRDAGGSRLIAFSERHFEGKKIGVNLLRTIILTYTHGDALNEMEHDANTHGHAIATQRAHYIKKLESELGKRKREEE